LFDAATHDGQRFSTRQQIQTEGIPRHPQMAIGPGGSLFIAWDEQTRGTRRVVAAQGAQAKGDAVHLTRQAVGGAERKARMSRAAPLCERCQGDDPLFQDKRCVQT
jgi:hypothetical protein